MQSRSSSNRFPLGFKWSFCQSWCIKVRISSSIPTYSLPCFRHQFKLSLRAVMKAQENKAASASKLTSLVTALSTVFWKISSATWESLTTSQAAADIRSRDCMRKRSISFSESGIQLVEHLWISKSDISGIKNYSFFKKSAFVVFNISYSGIQEGSDGDSVMGQDWVNCERSRIN